MKKVICFILAFLFLMSAAVVFAEDEITGFWGTNSWTLKGDTLYMHFDGETKVPGYIPVNAYWKANILAKGYEDRVKRIVFEEGLVEIAECRVGLSELEEIVIPKTVVSMPIWRDLTYVVDENNAVYSSEGGALFNKDKTAILACPVDQSDGQYTVPESVQVIEEYAFKRCKFNEVVLGQNVTEIKEYAFDSSDITRLNLPPSCKTIGEKAFFSCKKLEYLNLGQVEEIGEGAFQSTGLKEVVIPKSVKSLKSAFFDCRELSRVEIENGVAKIDAYAFNSCIRLSQVILPESVTEIGERAFSNTALTLENGALYVGDFLVFHKGEGEFVIKESVKAIVEGAFEDSLVSRIVLPEGIKVLNRDVFSGAEKLEAVVLPESLERIEAYAFNRCPLLKGVNIGKNVSFIDNTAFEFKLTALERIDVSEENLIYSSIDGVLFNKDKTELIRYPEGKKDAEYIVPESVERIHEGAFNENISLKKVVLSTQVTKIEKSTFSGCESLEEVVIGETTEIGESAFSECGKLKRLDFSNIASIGASAFYRAGIEEAVFGDALISIEGRAFYECRSLRRVEMGNKIKTIGPNAFGFCSVMEKVYIPDSVESVGDYAYQGCGMIKDVYIGSGEMGVYLFFNDIAIEKAILGDKVKNVSKYMFVGCKALKELYIGDGAEGSIEIGALDNCYKLEKLTIGKSITGIDGSLYSFSSLKEIVLSPENEHLALCEGSLFTKDMTKLIKYVGDEENENYNMPYGVKIIGRQAFSGAFTLKEINLPDTIEIIEAQAFWDCDSLTEIVIPKSLKEFGSMPFNGSSVEYLYYAGTKEEWIKIPVPGANGLSLVGKRIIQFDYVPINVIVNNSEVDFKTYGQRPYIKNGRTFVPLRTIGEAFGATLTWIDETKTAVIAKDETEVKISIGENKLYKNGEMVKIDAPAEITYERTMVPLRAIGEAFGCTVEWNDEDKTVYIS